MEMYEILGLSELIKDRDLFEKLSQHIENNTRYLIPGYKYDYRLHSTPSWIEFERCEDRNGQIKAIDIHCASHNVWRLRLDHVIDDSGTVHWYALKNREDDNVIPARIVCPDVLADARPMDMIEGQAVIFADRVEKVTNCEGQEISPVTQHDEHTISCSGEIVDCERKTFSFDRVQFDFWELDIDTANDLVTVIVRCDACDHGFNYGEFVQVHGMLSLDVAFDIKPKRSDNNEVEKNKYQNGFALGRENVLRVLEKCMLMGDFERLSRCSVGGFSAKEGDAPRFNVIMKQLSRALSFADTVQRKHVLTCKDPKLVGHEVLAAIRQGRVQYAVWVEFNQEGCVADIRILRPDECTLGIDHELHLYSVLAYCGTENKSYLLYDYLDEDCTYRSDYADVFVLGAKNIIERFSDIETRPNDDNSYTAEICLTRNELKDAATTPAIYQSTYCAKNYQFGKIAYVLFLQYNKDHKVTHMYLSRDAAHLKDFDFSKDENNVASVKDLLCAVYGKENTLRDMREGEADPNNDSYVWKNADAFATDWLQDNGYRISDAEIEEDCLGYACTRRGEKYAVFFYAYGKEKTIMLDGEYCAGLRDLPISKDRHIIVIYLHVDKKQEENGEISYVVESHGGADYKIEPWLLERVNGKNILRYYPRKEMMDLIPHIIYALKHRDLDVLKAICTPDAVFEDEEYVSYNGGLYGSLSAFCMKGDSFRNVKLAYLRENDVVYSGVPYVEGRGVLGFSVNSSNKIDKIYVHVSDEEYKDLLITEEPFLTSTLYDMPRLSSVGFLPPSNFSRFSLKLHFDNGEVRRYDLPCKNSGEEVVLFQGNPITDKIFANGRILESISYPDKSDWSVYRRFAERGRGIEWINGAAISALELYHNSYPVGSFDYTKWEEDVFVSQDDFDEDGFGVGCIKGLDPQNPRCLLDSNKKIATLLPEQYQQTPILIHPFCGGYSEGFVMVSEMGGLRLAYHHNFGSCAGRWGWLDTKMNVVIPPQYVYATNFWNGRATVCKGDWDITQTDEGDRYWCNNEQWGVIDKSNREIVPCAFDEVYEITDTDRLYLIHQGGFETGKYGVFDVEERQVILELDFDFDKGYMFNECFVRDDDLYFVDHLPGEGKDMIYVYSLKDKKYKFYAQEYTERTMNGESRVVVQKDGVDIIVF